MATLKEAVESGRRWRWSPSLFNSPERFVPWHGPGVHGVTAPLAIQDAIRDDFEIAPPEIKFSEQQFPCAHPSWWPCNPPEPEKPREWYIRIDPDGDLQSEQFPYPKTQQCRESRLIRVHDADACDRLRNS